MTLGELTCLREREAACGLIAAICLSHAGFLTLDNNQLTVEILWSFSSSLYFSLALLLLSIGPISDLHLLIFVSSFPFLSYTDKITNIKNMYKHSA